MMQKKTNVILEYTVVLGIIMGAVFGLFEYFRRHVQARVKYEWDSQQADSTHVGLEWESSASFSSSSMKFEQNEELTGNKKSYAKSNSTTTSINVATPSLKGWSVMEHKGSSLSAQDAAGTPPTPAYPSLTYSEWKDIGWKKDY